MMKYNPRWLFVLCAFTILILAPLIVPMFDLDHWDTELKLVRTCIEWIWLILIIAESRFRLSPYFRILSLFLAIFVVGLLFKIMHWPFANQMLMVAAIGGMIVYFVRFILKKSKTLLDLLKFLWLESRISIGTVGVLHLYSLENVKIIPILLFILMISFFTIHVNNGTAKSFSS